VSTRLSAETQADSPSGNHQHAGAGGSKWWTLTAVCLGTFMLLLDITIVNVALPDIQSAFKSSFSDLQWVIDAYALTLAALLLTAGSLADLYGRRRLYIIGLTIFTLASALCGGAQSTLMLQLSRGLQGVGGAIMFSVSLALLADAFRGRERGVAFGVWGAITGLAVAIGPLLGGALTTGLSWRWIFFVNLPLGVLAAVICVLKVTESRSPQARRPDWPGFALFTVALSSLVYGLIESNLESFSSGRVLGCLIAAGVLLIAFVAVEARGQHPMFDLALFRLPTFSGGSLAAFSLSASIFSLLLYLVLYLQDVLHYSALGTGVRLLVLSGGTLATSAVAGRLSSRVPVRYLIGPGLLLVGVGLLLMRGLDANSTWTHLIAGLIVCGAGVGMINPPLASTAVGVVPPREAGMASGINSTFRQVGIATGIAVLGAIFQSQIVTHTRAALQANRLGPAIVHATGPILNAALSGGGIRPLAAHLSPHMSSGLINAYKSGFSSTMNHLMLISTFVALVGAFMGFFMVRQRDFVIPTGAPAPVAAHAA